MPLEPSLKIRPALGTDKSAKVKTARSSLGLMFRKRSISQPSFVSRVKESPRSQVRFCLRWSLVGPASWTSRLELAQSHPQAHKSRGQAVRSARSKRLVHETYCGGERAYARVQEKLLGWRRMRIFLPPCAPRTDRVFCSPPPYTRKSIPSRSICASCCVMSPTNL